MNTKNIYTGEVAANRRLTNTTSRSVFSKAWRNIRALWNLACDPEVPAGVRLLAAGSLLYAASPIDFISDFPVIGWADDAAVLGLAITLLSRRMEKYYQD